MQTLRGNNGAHSGQPPRPAAPMTEPARRAARVQTGAALWSEDDKWHVVQRVTLPGRAPELTMFEKGYDMEAEATAEADAVSRGVRERAAEVGLPVFPTSETN